MVGNAPPNAPRACPRRTDEGSGPRDCVLLGCPHHLFQLGRARACDDTCAVDIAERARATVLRGARMLTFAELGALTGMDRSNVYRTYVRALKKLGIDVRMVRLRRALQRP